MATLPQVTSLSQITPFCSTVNPIKTPNFSPLTNIDHLSNVLRVEGNGAIFEKPGFVIIPEFSPGFKPL
jgi:hypothetical protein